MKKNTIISISAIVVVVLLVFLGIKYGMVDLSSNQPIVPEITNATSEAEDETKQVEPIGDDRKEPMKEDMMILLNKGESGIYENLRKGSTKAWSMRYEFKYLDSTISKKKPEGITRLFYKAEEGENPDSEGNFSKNDEFYYVAVTYDITNKMDADWDVLPISPQNLKLGYMNGDEYKAMAEPRGYVNSAPSIKGSFELEKDETATITNCYVIKRSDLEKRQLLVEASLMGQNKAIKTPYFVIETSGVIE